MRTFAAMCLAVVSLVLCGPAILGAQNWRQMGPPGGDVRSLAADPNDPRLLYLGTSDGHIFASRDGGEHWQLVGRLGDRTDSVVTAILADPRRGQTLYAGAWALGPNGGGVFRSEDGGATWWLIGLASQSVRALAQAPSHPDILIAGTLSGVFRSRDAGKTWERISPEKHEDLRNFDSLAIDPRNPDIIYAGTYHLAWKTTDGGRQWMPIHAGMIDDSDVMSLTIDHSDAQRVYASACSGIYRSENGGALWSKFRGIPASARRTHQIRQDPRHAPTLYSVTTQGLWKTTDAGATWRRITPANWAIIALAINPKNSDRLVIGVEGLGIHVSDDGGKTFRATNDGFYHRQVVDLALDHDRPNRMLVVLTNSVEPVLATEDGGRAWTRLGPGLKPHLLRRVYASPEGWWAALQHGGLLRYDRTKNTWAKAGMLLGKQSLPGKRATRASRAGAAPPLTQVVNDMAFARNLWLAATDQGLLASHDRGANWMPVPMGLAARLPVQSVRISADGSQVWAVSPHGMNFSRDGGKTWSVQELGLAARGMLRLYPADESTLLLNTGNALYISRDAGRGWQPANLPEPFLQDLAVVGNAWLISTQRLGLSVSYDQGRTWERLGGPLSEGRFPVLAKRGDTSMILAASSTEGLYALEIPSRGPVAASGAQPGERLGSGPPQR